MKTSFLLACGLLATHAALAAPAFYEELNLKMTQGSASQVDILLAIDNSGSMMDKQQNVIQNADLFIQEFTKQQGGLDWKMGLVSTDISNAPFLGFAAGDELNSKTPDPVAKFQHAVSLLGTLGSSTEQPLESMLGALQANPTFLRPGVPLALIIMSDEDEQSFGGSGAALYFKAGLEAIHKGANYLYASIADNATCGNVGFQFSGSVYASLLTLFNGTQLDLCSPNFGTDLAKMAAQIVSQAKPSYSLALSFVPQKNDLQIYYKGKRLSAVNGGVPVWTYDSATNSVFFSDVSFMDPSDNNFRVTYFYE